MQKFGSCSLHHVHGERNTVVDILVKDSLSSSRGTVLFRHPPDHIIPAVLDDIADVTKAILLAVTP